MPIILAIWETEIWRIMVPNQLWPKNTKEVHKTPAQQKKKKKAARLYRPVIPATVGSLK
jgi:hypothetical protein